MANQYELQDLLGVEVSSINIGEIEAGETSAETDLKIVSTGATNTDYVILGVLLATRTETSGGNEEGLEAYTEGWVEINTGSGWFALSLGAEGNVWSVPAGLGFVSQQFKIRVKIPSNAQSTGNIIISFELFYS